MKKENQRENKKIKMVCFIIVVASITIASIVHLCSKETSSNITLNVVDESSSQRDWIYSKNIDLNTGDTIYNAVIYTDGPFLSGYARVSPQAGFSLDKCMNKIETSIRLSVGDFIQGDKIRIFFGGMKPDLECTYTLESNQKAILDIPNPKVLIKKMNMHTFFTLELPIQKQGSKVPFTFYLKEGTLNL